jgi:hypothetical protein
MKYPMAANCLSKQEWDYMMAPVLEAGLNVIQFSPKFPGAIVYGLKQVQGLGMKDPYISQGLTWIQTLMQHGDRETVTGSPMQTSMEYLHLELDIGESFFKDNYNFLASLATGCWLKHVWQFQDEQARDPIGTQRANVAEANTRGRFSDTAFCGPGLQGKQPAYFERMAVISTSGHGSGCGCS